MKRIKGTLLLALTLVFVLFLVQCEKDHLIVNERINVGTPDGIELRKKPGTDIGNNLSFPVIWSDDVLLPLRGTSGEIPVLEGEWWYVWGPDPIDPNSVIYSCPPDPDNETLCADGSVPGEGFDNLVKAYLQKDPGNIWQAENVMGNGNVTSVNLIDWGDNLESVDWTTKSQIRLEVALYKTGLSMVQYPMKHISGWGIDEMHGIATTLGDAVLEAPGNEATVYSDNARLTIQKLNIPREEIDEGMLVWVNGEGWTEVDPEQDYINDPIYNSAIHENSGFSAEVNIKGKIIYGNTWNVRTSNEGEGDYRITFSFDDRPNLATSIKDASIIIPLDEEYVPFTESAGEPGGGTGVLVPALNLTYIDVRITVKNNGGGKG